eukprot:254339-Amphidinium_carterae.1
MQRDIEKPFCASLQVQLPQVGNIVPGQKELPTDIVGVAVEVKQFVVDAFAFRFLSLLVRFPSKFNGDCEGR